MTNVIEVEEFDDETCQEDVEMSLNSLAPKQSPPGPGAAKSVSSQKRQKPPRPSGFRYWISMTFSLPWLGLLWIFLSMALSTAYLGILVNFLGKIGKFVSGLEQYQVLLATFFSLVQITNLAILIMLFLTNKFLLRCCCGRRRESFGKSVSVGMLKTASWLLFLASYCAVLIMLVLLVASTIPWFITMLTLIICPISEETFRNVIIPLLAEFGLEASNEVHSADKWIQQACLTADHWMKIATAVLIIAIALIIVEMHALLYTRTMISRIGKRVREQ